MKIAIIGGARPNFMKIAPLVKSLEKQKKINYFLVNTGQHFSQEMADDFFVEFGINFKYNLKPSKASIIRQFSDISLGLENIFKKEKPDLVVVFGDVNLTLSAAIVANKMNIKLAHVEAGLRSFNKKMPEEHNRVITDKISDILFVTEESGLKNLKKEGIVDNVHFVGNIMIDTLVGFLPSIKKSNDNYYFCTIHRVENVDNRNIFEGILDAMEIISKDNKIYLPLHHRTKIMAKKFGLLERVKQVFSILEPLSYKESLYYQKNAKIVFTDSGGIQEETSYLGIPCLTLRTETERPVTIKKGTNKIAGIKKESIIKAYKEILDKKNIRNKIPYWDGKTSQRIINIIKKNEKR